MTRKAPQQPPENIPTRSDILREPDAARYVGMSRSYLRIARMHGRGPAYVRIGVRAIGYRLCDLETWLASRLVRTADAA
jgi:predicted DNA-binding transcriptional regulator AlpA